MKSLVNLGISQQFQGMEYIGLLEHSTSIECKYHPLNVPWQGEFLFNLNKLFEDFNSWRGHGSWWSYTKSIHVTLFSASKATINSNYNNFYNSSSNETNDMSLERSDYKNVLIKLYFLSNLTKNWKKNIMQFEVWSFSGLM